jgi:hypothetical protein
MYKGDARSIIACIVVLVVILYYPAISVYIITGVYNNSNWGCNDENYAGLVVWLTLFLVLNALA